MTNCSHLFREITNTHNWANGLPYRTYWAKCKFCNHKWKVYVDTEKRQEIELPQSMMRKRRLDESAVRRVLLDERSYSQIAKDNGITHQAVSEIKLGKSYKYFCKDIPRKAPRSQKKCTNCEHWWKGKCGLSVPEAGGCFAADCSFYSHYGTSVIQ